MPKYDKFRYIYPPRPENTIPSSDLDFWDNGSFIAQSKLNGANCTIYTNGVDYFIMNRHKERLSNFKMDQSEIAKLYRGDGQWMIINGEYMNTSKRDENRKLFNNKFVIFDILAINNEYLVGTTFSERVDLLTELYGESECEKQYLYQISENIYRVKSYYKGFKAIFDDFIKIDMLEGLVMKRSNAKLEIGLTEKNNTKTQIKCRKSTKNYKY